MAVKVSGTEVITDNIGLDNIVGASGIHGSLHPSPSVITSNVTFSNAMQTCIMTGNQSFTISGASEGRTTCVLLDTTSNAYTPTFPSTIAWSLDGSVAEPTWATYRHWQITLLSGVGGGYQIGSAVGYTAQSATPPTEAVTLHGTTSTPEEVWDGIGTGALEIGWRFKADGNVYKWQHPNNTQGNGETLYSTTKWNNITPTFNTGVNPSNTWYIRFSNFSGASISTTYSSSLNIWIPLNTTREITWYNNQQSNAVGTVEGVGKVEIGYVAGGGSPSSVTATGYYKVTYSGTA
jgi:hypothetical protein